MKNIEKLLFHASAYTVAISVLFFLFAMITGLDDASVSFGRYLLIFGFGLLISASEFIFTLKKLHTALRYIIHYSVLCIGFFVIFLSVKNSSGNSDFSAATVFAAVIIFSFVYALILLSVKLIKHLSGKSKKSKKDTSAKESNYTPRFK